MKIIALWRTTPVPIEYQECLDQWRNVDLIRIPFDSDDVKTIQLFFDSERLRQLIQRDDEDVLYVDCDCVPGNCFGSWKPDNENCSIYNLRGGRMDICAIYKPSGCGKDLQYILDRIGRTWADHYTILNGSLPFPIGRISGYPEFSIVNHKNLSTTRR
jgi:hypothetical protein